MIITFLGTGTSGGIPMIACDCEVCNSADPKDRRLRSSVLIQDDAGRNLLIDASSDFREQALSAKIVELEHILVTHIHADHVLGINEIRPFNYKSGQPVNIYLEKNVDAEIRNVFRYIYTPPDQLGGGVPQVENHIIEPEKSFQIYDFKITPIRVMHGKLPILGFRINDFVYITDASVVPEESVKYIVGAKALVINALREKRHPTHFSLEEAISKAKEFGVEQTYLTHIAHNIKHETVSNILSDNIQLAYDGLTISVK
ncbi:MBL fold metallo-hydrolase [bacterium]|nr:MBL fold metallo-hydrolase [bacterium]